MNGRILVSAITLLLLETAWLLAETPQRPVDRHKDDLPPAALARFGTARSCRADMAVQILYHPDGKMLATFGVDDAVILCDSQSGRRVRRIGSHPLPVRCAAFSPDGKWLASGDRDGNLLVSDFTTGKTKYTLKAPSQLTRVGFSHDGKTLGCNDLDGRIQLWSLQTGMLAPEGKKLAEKRCLGFEFSRDGKLLVLDTAADGIVQISTDDWESKKRLYVGDRLVQLASDSRHSLLHGKKSLSWWNLEAGNCVQQLNLDEPACSFAVHPDGKVAAVGHANGYFQVWDLQTGTIIKKCFTPLLYVNSLAFSPDGSRLAAAHTSIDLWNTSNWERVTGFDGPAIPPHRIAFAGNGTKILSLYSCQPHFQVRQWDVGTIKEVSSYESHDGASADGIFAGNGRWLIGRHENGSDSLTVRDARTGKPLSTLQATGSITGFTALRANHQLAAAVGNDRFVFWDLQTGKTLRTLDRSSKPGAEQDGEPRPPPPEETVYALSLSPRAKWLAGAEGHAQSSVVSIWNARTGVREMRFGGRFGRCLLEFFPVGRALADGLSERQQGVASPKWSRIDIWEPYSGSLRRQLPEVLEGLIAMTVSPDGKLIAAGYHTGIIRIWNIAANKQLASWQGHQGGVNDLQFSADGRTLASASSDTTILLWKTPAIEKPAGALAVAELDQCWTDLSNADAALAFTAIVRLADHPTDSLPYLERKLVAVNNRDRIAQLIIDLDHPKFRMRERASQELAALGKRARSAIEAHLKKSPTAEAHKRCEALLKLLQSPALQPGELQVERALEALQMMQTLESEKACKRLGVE